MENESSKLYCDGSKWLKNERPEFLTPGARLSAKQDKLEKFLDAHWDKFKKWDETFPESRDTYETELNTFYSYATEFSSDALKQSIQLYHRENKIAPYHIMITANMLMDMYRWKAEDVGQPIVNGINHVANGVDFHHQFPLLYQLDWIIVQPENKYYSEIFLSNRFFLFNVQADENTTENNPPMLQSYLKVQLQ